MRKSSRLKGGGYLISTASVFLLVVPALKGAAESAPMLLCLIAGAVLSIAGMGLRWRSHRLELELERKGDGDMHHDRKEHQDRPRGRPTSFG